MKNHMLTVFMLITCVLLMNSMAHALSISLEVPNSWIPRAAQSTSVNVTVSGNFSHYSSLRVDFSLSDVTRWPGRYMNDSLSDTLPDLWFDYYGQSTSGNISWAIGSNGQTATATFNPNPNQTRKEFYVKVYCYDYAAWGNISATLRDSTGGTLASSSVVSIPKDADGNKIADASDFNNYQATADDEEGPSGNSSKGDGFTIFEEYRGFLVYLSHRRTSVSKKDVFIYSTLPEGLGYSENMNASYPGSFAFHRIRAQEMGSQRQMNHRVCSGYQKMLQRAVRVRVGTENENDLTDAYGEAFPFGHLYSPNIPANMVQAIIYTINIENDRQKQQEQLGRPYISQSEIVKIVIAHEVAHHMHVNEYYSATDSAMRRTTYLDQKRGVFPAHLHNSEYELTNY